MSPSKYGTKKDVRWHVRTRDNIARVKRDEARAAEEEKEKETRIALAEQEARTEKLRIKARDKNLGNTHYDLDQEVFEPQPKPDGIRTGTQLIPRTHINFFSEIESRSNTNKSNKDHEADKKEEQEAYEKKIGLLVGLGQSAVESQSVKPWYQQNREEKDKERVDAYNTDTSDMKRKASMDPMNDMMRYLGKKPKIVTDTKKTSQEHPSKDTETLPKEGLPGTISLMTMFSKYKKSKEEGNGKESYRKYKEKKRNKKHRRLKESRRDIRKHSHKKSGRKNRKQSRPLSDSTSSEGKDSRQEIRMSRRHQKLHKRDKKNRHKSSRSESDSLSTSGSSKSEMDNQKPKVSSKPTPTIEQLRADRIKREAAERTKTERFLAGKPLVEQPATEQVITDKLDGKYNSQFNPHLARKHQPKAPLF
ncbi:leukocyte receptor cluster member 1 homolog [Lytechinus pictus]|uniref:leukocyte receptor cluster member 1 homolog n=1 Tax=Lytechinus pictus TaxID=7653 RepID=UPI0030B9BDDA